MKFSKPGDLIEASRDKRQKRAVMKAIGMPMKSGKKSKKSLPLADAMALKKAKKKKRAKKA